MGLLGAVGELGPSDNKEQHVTVKMRAKLFYPLCFLRSVLQDLWSVWRWMAKISASRDKCCKMYFMI